MDAFLAKFSSVSFKVLIVSFVLMLITGTSRRLLINKTIQALIELPDERRQRLMELDQRAISMWRIVFWAAPLYLIVIPMLLLAVRAFLPSADSDFIRLFFPVYMTGMVELYIYTLDDFFYRKKLLKAVDESRERKV